MVLMQMNCTFDAKMYKSIKRYMKKKCVLVTGGTGFIGSHLCERLLQEGARVICMDNLFSSTLDSIAHLISHEDFKFVEWDITVPFDCEVDEIYNMACPASPVHYQFDPIKTTTTCVMGAINVLELAKKYNAKVMQASTSEIYGDPLEHPQRESYFGNVNTVGPRSCYDEGKRCAETLFTDYKNQQGVRIKIIRIFNTYGPRMLENDGRVISNFIVRALRNQPLDIYGDGLQTRSFQYIDDLIEGMLRVMATPDNFSGPVNLGNPVEYTIKQLAEKVAEMIDCAGGVNYHPLPTNDPLRRQPDITLAKKTLDWEPKVALHEGLIKTIAYFKDRIQTN